MDRKLISWHSPALRKEMPIAGYGHYGFAVLMIPTASADYLEYERFQLIESVKPLVEQGICKIYSVNSMNSESWMNRQLDPWQKLRRHQEWNQYIFEEVIPYIKSDSSPETPIYTCGASFGALHGMNLFLQRPGLIKGTIAMSGVYDLTEYTDGFYNDDIYFNSPMHYMPNLTDPHLLELIRQSRHIHILSGSGEYEDPGSSGRFAKILYDKGIWYELDIWGAEWKHDWPTWRAMLPLYLGTRFN